MRIHRLVPNRAQMRRPLYLSQMACMYVLDPSGIFLLLSTQSPKREYV